MIAEKMMKFKAFLLTGGRGAEMVRVKCGVKIACAKFM